MVLETPCEKKDEKGKAVEDKGVWAREIKLLESLVGMDVEGEEFKKLEADLAEEGREEREKMMVQFERLEAERKRKAEKGEGKKRKSKKGKSDEPVDDSSEDGESSGLSDPEDGEQSA